MLADDDFAQFIQQLTPRMLRTAYRLLGHAHDAEDALQDCVWTIHRRWHRVRKHPNPAALGLRICAQAALDRLRRQSRNRTLVRLAREDDIPGDADAVSAMMLGERRDAIRLTLLKLSDNQRLAVVMRYFQEQSHSEVAAAMGCREATARKHLQRGLERLASLLAPLAAEWSVGGHAEASLRTVFPTGDRESK